MLLLVLLPVVLVLVWWSDLDQPVLAAEQAGEQVLAHMWLCAVLARGAVPVSVLKGLLVEQLCRCPVGHLHRTHRSHLGGVAVLQPSASTLALGTGMVSRFQ